MLYNFVNGPGLESWIELAWILRCFTQLKYCGCNRRVIDLTDRNKIGEMWRNLLPALSLSVWWSCMLPVWRLSSKVVSGSFSPASWCICLCILHLCISVYKPVWLYWPQVINERIVAGADLEGVTRVTSNPPPGAAAYLMLLLWVWLKLFRCRFVPLLEPNPPMLACFACLGSQSHPL